MRLFILITLACFTHIVSAHAIKYRLVNPQANLAKEQAEKYLEDEFNCAYYNVSACHIVATKCSPLLIRDWEKPDRKESWCGNITDKYISTDFSELFLPKPTILGYIGDNYQRLHITFDSAQKDKHNDRIYHVTGSSMVNNHKINFVGEIELVKIVGTRKEYGPYISPEKFRIKQQGSFYGKYHLREDPKEKRSGEFKGDMLLHWLVLEDGSLKYEVGRGDAENNNQFVGTWTSYKTKVSKTANWGIYRIPESIYPYKQIGKKFDYGAGEFSPNKKAPGWEDFTIEGVYDRDYSKNLDHRI